MNILNILYFTFYVSFFWIASEANHNDYVHSQLKVSYHHWISIQYHSFCGSLEYGNPHRSLWPQALTSFSWICSKPSEMIYWHSLESLLNDTNQIISLAILCLRPSSINLIFSKDTSMIAKNVVGSVVNVVASTASMWWKLNKLERFVWLCACPATW
jgi:hypothetical protein